MIYDCNKIYGHQKPLMNILYKFYNQKYLVSNFVAEGRPENF